jgi:hypothetical protein
MPASLQALRSQRDGILDQMKQIDHLRRGSLSRQFFKTRRDGRIFESGPYFVLQCFFKGKKCSERVPASRAGEVQKQVENFRRFNALAEEFVSLSDQITQLESSAEDSKKNAFNRPNATTNDSKKPRHS